MPFTRRYCREVNGHFFQTDHSKLHMMVAVKADTNDHRDNTIKNTNALAPFQLATFFVPLEIRAVHLQIKSMDWQYHSLP